MPEEEIVPRECPSVVVEVSVDGEDGLLYVSAGVRLAEVVEEHAELHRRERVEVVDEPCVADDGVELGLGEVAEREVGGVWRLRAAGERQCSRAARSASR